MQNELETRSVFYYIISGLAVRSHLGKRDDAYDERVKCNDEKSVDKIVGDEKSLLNISEDRWWDFSPVHVFFSLLQSSMLANHIRSVRWLNDRKFICTSRSNHENKEITTKASNRVGYKKLKP